MSLSDEELKKIARMFVDEVKATHHDFWIDPESHYNDHIRMREITGAWSVAKSIFVRAFIGLVVVGAITLAAFALFFKAKTG